MHTRIRIKALVIIIPVLFFIIVLSYLASVNTSKNIIHKEVYERISVEKEIYKTLVEKSLDCAKQISSDLAFVVVDTYKNELLDQYINILKSVVKDNTFILGAGIWFEPHLYSKSEEFVGPYVYKSGKKLLTTFEYSNVKYNYFSQEYYKRVKESKKVIFTDMYYDKTSGLYMITCSYPMIDSKGVFVGCITVDLELSTIQNFISGFNKKHVGEAYIVNGDGRYLASEKVNLVKNREILSNSRNDSFKSVVKMIMSNTSGESSYVQDSKKICVYFDTINDLGWKMVYEIPEDLINDPLYELSKTFMVIFGSSLFLVSLVIFIFAARNIEQPVIVLLDELNKIRENDYEESISDYLTERKDEFGLIGRSLQTMKVQLKKYQEDLKESIEENVAANEELIQQNEELIESETRIIDSLKYSNSLMEAIPDTVFVISEDGEFLDCLGDTKHLFYSKDEFIGRKIVDVMPPYIANPGMIMIREVCENGKTKKISYEWSTNGVTEYHELKMVKWFDGKVIAIARNITDTQVYLKEIEYISYHDQVTGLFNRRYFDKKLVELNHRDNYPLSLIISDLNGLKMINDSFGHEQGDYFLLKYAQILLDTGINADLVSRVGGDEFAIVLSGKSQCETEQFIRTIMDKCSKERVNGVELSVSFGYSIIQSEDQSIQTALIKAEDQMYQNKLFEASSRRGKTIDVILSTLHEKNPREEKHSRRVAELCEIMAMKMGMLPDEVNKIKTAGALHDIGKIGIQEELLNKPGKLTNEEYESLCKHPEVGYRILNTAPNMSGIADIVLSHHERWDGKGYPKGIKGEEIPLYARIISIVDTYDAMTSERSYRKALSSEVAIQELIKNSGTQFDPSLTAFFVSDVLGGVT